MTNHRIIALVDTWLKTEPKDSTELRNDQKNLVRAGEHTHIVDWEEIDAHSPASANIKVELGHGAGIRYLHPPHWKDLPWMHQPSDRTMPIDIDWFDWSCPVSQYFTVGEVTLRQKERIPTDAQVQQRIIKLARAIDEVREWWGGAFGVTSWNRPPDVNRRVGGVPDSQHTLSWAIDFYPLDGSVWDLQRRFEQEWFNAGKWDGGFGKGAKRGFIHLDLGPRRGPWNY